ncbi:glycerophosphoryl diester phosphodiesterase membrane domain-containing protein [Streptomyces palmae]|uniref:Glycerophosphoryl diester phosphodiesterase membrane domain-containing protein n=1 Tax=Streptomyces palmae TaxID=1701085 RepID=A0A4Z0HDE2_9ACTN|nr:glycerophosphoryl diester phosphodiesterase membrane domain-containing protein [Streptomyces palmae]TGB14872.1 hypothetical protein E4099_07625 [Streptomyces palmae]
MNDSPGRMPPGSQPAGEPDHDLRLPEQRGPSGTAPEEADRPAGSAPAEADGPTGRPPQPPAASEGQADSAEQPAWGAGWAKRQPPPGNWTPPGGTPPPGTANRPPAPGPQPGWRPPPPQATAGWTIPPPAARPGVIPLRPLRTGEILDGAVATVRTRWRAVLGVSVGVAVVSQTLLTLATGLWFQHTSSGLESLDESSDPTLDETLHALRDSLTTTGVSLLIGVLGTVLATALLTTVTARAVLGRPVGPGEVRRTARPQLGRLCGLLLALPAIMLGAVLAGIAPGVLLAMSGGERGGASLAMLGAAVGMGAAVWLWIRYSLAAPALMLEKSSVADALRRSAKLVRGAWWRIFGIQLLALVIVFIAGAIVEIPSSVVAMAVGGDSATDWLSGDDVSVSWPFLSVIGVGGILSTALTLPVTASVTALLYMDQRIRRESLDLELARAADPKN